MGDFFTRVVSIFSILSWSDWLTIAMLIGFILLGYKRGLVRELINFAFFIATIFISWLFYESLANSTIITWLVLSQKSYLTISFGVIFIGLLILKKSLYKVIEMSTSITKPCSLNKAFTRVMFLALALFVSWQYIIVVSQIDSVKYIIPNDSLRLNLSFIVIFGLITGTFFLLAKVFNIAIDDNKPCLLAPLFEKILSFLHGADNILNARNVNNIQNKVLGSLTALIKGTIFVLVMVLILQNVSWVSQQYFWVETDGALRFFQDIATSIKPTLSQYFLFIELE
jgi:uncharacterized membrane protein required for colicin V production